MSYPFQGFTVDGRDIWDLSNGAVTPPLVSFVVISWNYADYVGAAIDSIRRQDYPHFECLVVDNGSTDDSASVIARHVADDRRFSVLTFPENRGQLGAAFAALEKIKGGFVTFVDADDILFQNFASVHVQAHLALPQAVAFTSSNVVQTDASGRTLTAFSNPSGANRAYPVSELQPESAALRVPTLSREEYELLSAKVAVVPISERRWVWGSGTSNMYRTSILRLIRLGDGSRAYLRSADGYFNVACHGLAGGALIDMSLSAYRIHGKNYFASLEKLQNLRSGTREYAQAAAEAVYDDIELFLREAERFSWILGKNYFPFVDRVTRAGRPASHQLRRFYRSKRAYQLFIDHAPELKTALGLTKFVTNIALRFSPWQAARIYLASRKRK